MVALAVIGFVQPAVFLVAAAVWAVVWALGPLFRDDEEI